VLRDLPFSARLTLACFLLAVGLGYTSAMVQLHLQHAGPGSVLPTPEDVVRHFHGSAEKTSPLEQLITADEARPFTGTGSMAAAFTRRSDGWTKAIKDRPETDVRAEREGERLAVLDWIRAGVPEEAYTADKFPLPAGAKAITPEYRDGDSVKIRTLFTDRCVRCHAKEGDDEKATKYPLETMEQIRKYATPDVGGGRVSIEKLTQSTHAHLLSFAVLFTLTGVLFALTNYPGIFRVTLAPLVLVAQVADIACWWLARIDGPTGEQFARAIPLTGAVVGGGLALQIVLTLFHLFGALGKLLLVVLFAAAGFAGLVAKEKVVEPYLKAKAEAVRK
ncbi:MAG: hypothetical protein K1X57_20845, partial [Gemmataceae bacterium]|nr:hypothetical protein [Gemmataceae bacterium]